MININNPILRGTSGQLGKEFVVRKVRGKQVISKFPAAPDPSRQTEAQRATRTRFKNASAYAKDCMLRPERKEYYQELSDRLMLPNAYTAAVKDFMMNAPESGFSGCSSDGLRLLKVAEATAQPLSA